MNKVKKCKVCGSTTKVCNTEIGVNGKNKYIGRYNTLEEATKARRDAELLYYNVNYEINQTKF